VSLIIMIVLCMYDKWGPCSAYI